MRAWGALLVGVFWVLLTGGRDSLAEMTLTTSWERPVKFKVVDAESGAPIAQPLVILKMEKHLEGTEAALPFYDVMQGAATGFADYRVSTKSLSAVVMVLVPGYRMLTQKLIWKDLPARQFDSAGIETSVPTITLAVTPLGRASGWPREYRFVIVPELEDITPLSPPYLSREEKKLLEEFLRREENRLLGL